MNKAKLGKRIKNCRLRLGKLTGIVLATSEKGLDGNYYGDEQIIAKAQDAGISLLDIASDVFDQPIQMGWEDAVATYGDDRFNIDLVEVE